MGYVDILPAYGGFFGHLYCVAGRPGVDFSGSYNLDNLEQEKK